jgi:acetoin utilization deacetylase AcuC-like enzyme
METQKYLKTTDMSLLLVCIQKPNYPAKKSMSDLDVELEDNVEDEAYMKTLKFYLNELNSENFDFVFLYRGC